MYLSSNSCSQSGGCEEPVLSCQRDWQSHTETWKGTDWPSSYSFTISLDRCIYNKVWMRCIIWVRSNLVGWRRLFWRGTLVLALRWRQDFLRWWSGWGRTFSVGTDWKGRTLTVIATVNNWIYVPVTAVIHSDNKYLLRTCQQEGMFMGEKTKLK